MLVCIERIIVISVSSEIRISKMAAATAKHNLLLNT